MVMKMLKIFFLEGTKNHSQSQKGKNSTRAEGDNSNPNESRNFHLLNQFLQEIRSMLHEMLDALHIVGNLSRH